MQPRRDESENNLVHTRSLIESAMDRAARDAQEGAPIAASADSRLGRPECDRAHPLAPEQRSAASGNEVNVATAPLQPARPTWAAGQARTYRLSTVLLSGVFSALGTAGLMWLANGAQQRGGAAVPAPQAAVAPAVLALDAKPTLAAVGAPEPAPVDDDESQARAVLERWRQAWASRDVEAYLACYSRDFLPADGQTRSAWAATRRNKLSSRSDISLQVHDVRVERVDGDHLKVVFLQDYASGTYRESARPKTLLLARTGADWRIAGEWQGGLLAAPLGRMQTDPIDRVVFRHIE